MAILKRCRKQVKFQTEFSQICQCGSTQMLRYCHGYWPHTFYLLHNFNLYYLYTEKDHLKIEIASVILHGHLNRNLLLMTDVSGSDCDCRY